MPSIAPLLEDYEVAGWTQQAETVGGDFHDWFVQTDGRLALVVGDADGTLLDAARRGGAACGGEIARGVSALRELF